MLDLEALTETALSLEPMPASVVQLARLVSEEEVPLQRISEVIELDPALTAQVLRAANSAAHMGRRQIVTVRDAVVRLGAGTVLGLCVGSRAKNLLEGPIPQLGLEAGALWRHSVAAAIASDKARSYCSHPIPPETYAAALLHQLGQLVLARHLQAEMIRLWQDALTRADSSLDEEAITRELFGVTSAELTGLIVGHWQLSDVFVKAVSYAPDPNAYANTLDANARTLTACRVVHLGHFVAQIVEEGDTQQRPLSPITSSVLEHLGCPVDRLASLKDDVAYQLSDMLARF